MKSGIRWWILVAGVFVSLLAGPAPALGATETSVIVNGGFENGTLGWTQSAQDGHEVIAFDPANARSGSWVARLGGHKGGSDSVVQGISIPVTASRATLQFWYRVVSEDSAEPGWDHLAVRAISSFGAQVIADFDSRMKEDWRQSAAVDVTMWRGSGFGLVFQADLVGPGASSFYIDDVTLTIEDLGLGRNYTGLWWNPSEPGWGIAFSHQGGTLFGTLFTYDWTGAPLWLAMPAGRVQRSGYTYTGTLYRMTGSPFGAVPFTPSAPANRNPAGSMTVSFSGDGTAVLDYSVDGVYVRKRIQRQVFNSRAAVCEPTTEDRARLANYQDLWWNPDESGWGLHLAHQGDILFGTLFTYEASGRDLWLVMPRGERRADGAYVGTLYRTRGSPFNGNPFWPLRPEDVTAVGEMRLQFADGVRGTLSYTYDGVPVSKAITRQVFSSPAPACVN